jgi:simple sugar transport system substrate-binding protein
MKRIDSQVEEAVETLPLSSVARRRLLTGGGLFSASLAASALLAGCGEQAPENDSGAGVGDFPATPKWKFTFVNHVTTNPFFQPTQYGAADACALLGLPNIQWTGSKTSVIGEMVSAVNSATSANVDGIAVCVVDTNAFKAPIDNALDKGIPVVTYNADGAVGNPGSNRLGYIGQDLFTSGVRLGERIASLVDGGKVVGFIATPGQLNIQPRIDGAKQAILDSKKDIKFDQIATGAELPQELSTIDAYYQGHKDLKGMFAVDAGSTQGVGEVMTKYKLKDQGIAAGGFDLVPKTLEAVKAGNLDFTIDQQPYLQGFLPVLQLYFYKLSGGLVTPSDTNTGLSFITKENVDPFLTTKTRFQGSSKDQQLVKRSGPIPHG